jgi:hypothetical protein
MLKEKTMMNKKTAEWAERNEYYDVAVSRYYYSVFQKLLYLVNKKEYISSKDGNNSHNDVYEYFLSKYNLAPEQRQKMYHFRKFKDYRKKADYEDEILTKNDIETDVKPKYYLLISVLDKVIAREDKDNG